MKNINKNASHMLVTTHDSYLVHRCFPTCSLDGDKPFTIEVQFSYQDCNHGSFYCQEDGLDLGFKNALPYFSHPALGNLYAPDSLVLGKSFCHFLAVVYDQSSLTMYINGFEAASVKVSKAGAQNTNDFNIGKEFNGFIGGVRVLSRAMAAEEIMADNGKGFQKDADCELWTDFSGIGYKDISKNAMGLWRTGSEAECVNVVNCTMLRRNGLYVRGNGLDYDSAFSLAGKIYPDIAPAGNYYIYTLYGNSGAYLQVYLANKDGAYYLTADIGGNVLMSQTKLQGMMWIDYAVTVDIKDGNVCLYQDGVKCAEQKYTGLKAFEKATAIIGGKYFTGKPDYSDSFNGLLDYCAEFNRVLTDTEVDKYAEDQPYLFADGLSALVYFGWGEAEDIFADAPLAKYGAGYFTMVADTNNVTAPIGLNWYIPEDGKAYWSSLSEYDRWDFQTKISIIQDLLENFTGIPMKSQSGDFQKPLSKAMEKMLREMPSAESTSQEDYVETIALSCFPLFPRMQAELIDVPFEGIHFFSLAGVSEWIEDNWKIIAGISTILVAAAAFIIAYCGESQKDRPENDHASLEVKWVSWNQNGNPRNGSIHFHNDKNDPTNPYFMEFSPRNSCINLEGVFIPSELEKINMDIQVKNVGTKAFCGRILLEDMAGREMADSGTTSIDAGSLVTVSLVIEKSMFPMPEFGKATGEFQIKYIEDNKETFLINCNYKLYTLLGKPISPWDMRMGEYDPNCILYISTPLLDVCLDIFNVGTDKVGGNDSLIMEIINGMNSCQRFEYDTNGATNFLTNEYCFKYIKFIKAFDNNVTVSVNCIDCSTIVSSLCAMHGQDYPMIVLLSPSCKPFNCNQVQIIGTSVWQYPGGTTRDVSADFLYHVVNRSNEEGVSCQTQIYDACLKVDGGKYPGKPEAENKDKDPTQPLGMNALKDYSPAVNIDSDDEYTENTYRERLVEYGEEVSFCTAEYRVLLPEDIESEQKKQDTLYTEQIFGRNDHISDLILLDDISGELDWSFAYDGETMEICCITVREEPRKAVGKVLKWYNNPDRKDVSVSYPGSCCYTVTDQAYILWKEGKVYKIHGTHAKEVADYIYQA